ncbi:ABC transporter ATP-binding protein [Microlunatus sp. GCM10028923]|uniref:ABC transporter ATP-binding protein n=1 Tax=Microlunatus sp. GCM10028923 TaxID=3273400 RepID=UPI0036193AF8
MTNAGPVLSVKDLTVEYRTEASQRSDAHVLRAVDRVSFELYPHESIALIGESGCGKTTLALSLLRLLPKIAQISGGELEYRNRAGELIDLRSLSEPAMRRFRWSEAAIVFQGAMNSFNPVLKIKDQMADTIRDHQDGIGKREITERAEHALREVDLEPGRVLRAYPHELSGGMRQRVLIAMAILLEPQILILDEPTTALDILTQRRIVDLIYDLHERLDFAMIFVSHDLAVAAELATRVATMYDGEMVEVGDVRDIFYRPQHPYTQKLIGSVPTLTGATRRPDQEQRDA